MKNGASGAIDRTNGLLVERHEMLAEAFRFVGIEVKQAAPSTSYPNYVVTCVYRAVDYCFDTGV
jgi:hypothetical protein